MRPFFELTRRGKLIEVLRWFCVLPLALLADAAVREMASFLYAAAHFVTYSDWGIFLDSSFPKPVRVFLFYVVPMSAFVIAGAKMAPRYRTVTAIVLNFLGIFFSLMTHVIFLHFAGDRAGITNYTHLAAETLGLLSGVGGIVWLERRRRGTDGTCGGGKIEDGGWPA
jgi:hypothetical protein